VNKVVFYFALGQGILFIILYFIKKEYGFLIGGLFMIINLIIYKIDFLNLSLRNKKYIMFFIFFLFILYSVYYIKNINED